MREHERLVATTGIHNFRDCGGYRVADGARLAPRMLYRSGEHARATDEDLRLVTQCGLTAIVDLRGSSEREKAPCRRPLRFAVPVYFAADETSMAPHLEAASTAFDAASARRNMHERYAEIPFRPVLLSMYRQYFKAVAESGGPTLVYCAAGKDRTGVLVALLQTAVGVHHDDVFEDYILTNTAGDTERRIAALRPSLERRFGAAIPDEAVRVIAGVEPAYLQTAFDAIAARHGSIGSYLSDVLNLTPAIRRALVERLVQ